MSKKPKATLHSATPGTAATTDAHNAVALAERHAFNLMKLVPGLSPRSAYVTALDGIRIMAARGHYSDTPLPETEDVARSLAPVVSEEQSTTEFDLFTLPTSGGDVGTLQQIAELARGEFEKVTPPVVVEKTFDELHKIFHELAPAVRQASAAYMEYVDEYDIGGNCTTMKRFSVSALFAHFGYVALALAEAEEKEVGGR
ncbi:MAG TPA: hypothetical protein VF719_11370 [Abditibacteriaceae bacterium]|jgi:hypothetical protein